MKKNLLFIFLIGILSNNSLYAQNNYLNEAKYISEVIKKIEAIEKAEEKKTDISIKLTTGDKKQLKTDNVTQFNALYNKLISTIDTSKASTHQTVDTATKETGKPKTDSDSKIPVGKGKQPKPSPASPAPQKKDGQITNGQDTIKSSNIKRLLKDEEAKNELMYILYIKQNDTAGIYDKDIIANTPKKFGAFKSDNKNLIGGTSDNKSTNFAFAETQIIYGIVDFTISRAKEQLVEKYLSAWYEKLDSEQIVKEMIPQTLGTLKAFNDEQSLSMARFGDKWKSAFQEDLRNVPLVLQKETFVSMLLNKANVCDDQSKQVAPIIAGGSRLVYDLYLKKHLVNIVGDMSADYLLEKSEDPVFKQAIILTDVLLKAGGEMKDNDTYIPVDLEGFKQMDEKSWKAFVKLLYIRHQEELKYVFGGNINKILDDLIQNNNGQINQFANLFKQTIGLVSTYQTMINGGTNEIKKELSIDDTRKLFDISFQLTQQGANILSYFFKLNNISSEKLDIFKKVSKDYYTAIAEIAEGVTNKQYGTVVDGTLAIMRMVDTQNKMGDVISKLQIYGSFMVNIIKAKDADEVKSSLEELIPKNLYQLKNTHSFSIALTAYPGVFVGREQITQTGGVGTSVSPFMPIGIDFSIGNKRVKGSNNYFSSTNFFVQFIDFGAVMNYRLNDAKDEEANPNVTFKQLFSPGFTVMRHLRNSPVVIGGGVNYTPSLRTVNTNGNETKENVWRVGLFCAVDVTFFHLYNSKKILK